jgi:16S rRNA (guanine527-N7)-methyltransferase
VTRVTERVGELVARYDLEPGTAQQAVALLDLLEHDPHAPSSVRDAERAVDIHLADSLSALDLECVRAARRLVDLGAGAGFPGLALALALPRSSIMLLEAAHRKCEFLARAIVRAGATNATVVCARAEQWPDGIGLGDLVTARAVGELALVCEYAAPLLALGGSLVAWKGTVSQQERADGERAARELGLEPRTVIRTSPYPGCTGHTLHVYAKIADTPARFPRRPGVARKQPLGRR